MVANLWCPCREGTSLHPHSQLICRTVLQFRIDSTRYGDILKIFCNIGGSLDLASLELVLNTRNISDYQYSSAKFRSPLTRIDYKYITWTMFLLFRTPRKRILSMSYGRRTQQNTNACYRTFIESIKIKERRILVIYENFDDLLVMSGSWLSMNDEGCWK